MVCDRHIPEPSAAIAVPIHQYGVNTDQEHAEQAKAGWSEFFDRMAEHLASS
ncbi:hypothetical protein ABZV14_11130 [Streptosporangium canum]|uniref:hypothetical protein n=1 Tax=Streptosporangium canum TaxID=324952 RepID=UPI0033B8811F